MSEGVVGNHGALSAPFALTPQRSDGPLPYQDGPDRIRTMPTPLPPIVRLVADEL